MRTPQVVTFGECMAAFRSDGPLAQARRVDVSIAGAEANVAIGLTRLGHTVRFVGTVGRDPYGDLVARTLRAEGVHTVIEEVDRPTGTILFERFGRGVRVTYRRAESAGAVLGPADLGRVIDEGFAGVVHLTGITPALGSGPRGLVEAVVAQVQQATVVLDVNHRSTLWSAGRAAAALTPILPAVDVLLGSPEELAMLAPQASDEDAVDDLIRQVGVRTIVRKLGADGARLTDGSGSWHQAAVPGPVVDLVGAGDAFAAGFISGLLDDLPPAECLHRAVDVAAHAIAGVGDWEHLPTRSHLQSGREPGEAIR